MIKLILFTESVFMLASSYRINLSLLSQRETGRGRIKWGLFLITYASASTVFVCFSYSLKHSLISPCSVFPLEKSSNSVNDKQEFGGADSSRPKPSGLAGLCLQMLSQPTFKVSPWQQMSLLVRPNFGVSSLVLFRSLSPANLYFGQHGFMGPLLISHGIDLRAMP